MQSAAHRQHYAVAPRRPVAQGPPAARGEQHFRRGALHQESEKGLGFGVRAVRHPSLLRWDHRRRTHIRHIKLIMLSCDYTSEAGAFTTPCGRGMRPCSGAPVAAMGSSDAASAAADGTMCARFMVVTCGIVTCDECFYRSNKSAPAAAMSSSDADSAAADGRMAHRRPARSASAAAGSVPTKVTSAMPPNSSPAAVPKATKVLSEMECADVRSASAAAGSVPASAATSATQPSSCLRPEQSTGGSSIGYQVRGIGVRQRCHRQRARATRAMPPYSSPVVEQRNTHKTRKRHRLKLEGAPKVERASSGSSSRPCWAFS